MNELYALISALIWWLISSGAWALLGVVYFFLVSPLPPNIKPDGESDDS